MWGNFAYHSQSEPSSQKELGHDPLGKASLFFKYDDKLGSLNFDRTKSWEFRNVCFAEIPNLHGKGQLPSIVCRGWFTGGKGRKERCGKKARALQSVSILHVNVGLVAAWA